MAAKVSNEKIVNKMEGLGKKAASKALTLAANKKLGHGKAQALKMTLSILLYTASIVGIIMLFLAMSHVPPLNEFVRHPPGPVKLGLRLKDCVVDLLIGDEEGLHIHRTTADLEVPGNVVVTDISASEFIIGCAGPSNEEGDFETLQVEIGPDIVIGAVDVSFESEGGAVRAKGVEVRDKFSARGRVGIVQLDGDNSSEVEIQLDVGYVGLVNSQFERATLIFGEEVDVYFWQYSSQQGVQVTIDTTESENATGGLCVSDNTTTPVLSQDVEGDAHFTLGVPPYRHINVTRKNGNNAMIFSHGVWISDRNCLNSFDTFGSAFNPAPTLGEGFKEWAKQAYDAGMEIMNLWLVGATLGQDAQSIDSTGSWVFTTTGSGLIWFPMRSWKIFTLGIMEPRAVRGMALVRDKTCLSNYAKLVQGKPGCRPSQISEQAVISDLKQTSAMAIRKSLPLQLNLTNAPNSRIYYVQDVPVQAFGWPSIADGRVSILATKTGGFVKDVISNRGYFHGFVGYIFISALFFLPFVGGAFACALVVMLYRMEKRRYLRARGTEKPKKPKKSAEAWGESDVELDSKEERRARSKKSIYSQKFSADVAEEILEYLDAEAKSNLLLTIVRCLILRSPAGGKELSVKELCEMVFGHFMVMQLLVVPFVLLSVLMLENLGAARAMCGHNAWVAGRCINRKMIDWSTVLIVLAVVIDSFFFLNSILEYTTRYALDMLESTGSAPKCFKRMMHIRASKFYSKTLSAVMGFALFVFCAYFILVCLFILLGTLLHPSQLAPVLLAIGGAAVVGQQITMKFKEMVEKAKKIAADLLKQAEGFLKDGESMVKGVAGDALKHLDKIPGGNKVSGMLDKMPDLSVEQLIEQGKEQMIQALDKVENVEDVARMLHGLAQSASQMVQGVAAQNVGDVSRMLTTLGRSNKGAAGQMLQAALVNHRESALKMVQEMAARDPSMAAGILTSIPGADTVMSMVEELPPEVQGPLREALGSAFPSGLDSAMDSEMKASPGLSLDEANMTDIVENLQGLATSNPDAASQLLQAVVASSPASGSEMMQKMASMSPASAVAMVKGLAAGNPTQAIQLLELLADTKEAEQLQDLLKDAGLPVNAAQIRMAKEMLEKLMQGNFNPMDALKSAVGQEQEKLEVEIAIVEDVQKAVDDMGTTVDKAEEEKEDFDENILMMLGLSKGQLILLNIQAVLIFLFWVSFMLMGAYLFLGSEALLPQLVANVSAVGSAVTMIRSKSNELKSGDLKAIQSTMQGAASKLQEKPELEKKTQ
ncbi:unnamed protein product [Durusdinium trenchii]|uniref:Uncharacterized protein n=2 Tax=Durusdinium trenchii TaxID=1381693 RepID=A0ABP0S3S3_9DINO